MERAERAKAEEPPPVVVYATHGVGPPTHIRAARCEWRPAGRKGARQAATSRQGDFVRSGRCIVCVRESDRGETAGFEEDVCVREIRV